jgi:hypothetical protein
MLMLKMIARLCVVGACLLLAACGAGSSVAKPTATTGSASGVTAIATESAPSTATSTASQVASTTQVSTPSESTEPQATSTPSGTSGSAAGNTSLSATATGAKGTTSGPLSNYQDDRSGPVQVLESLYNAVNSQEYARAYSYWEESDSLPPFDQFQAGYANTQSVDLTTGEVNLGAAAGNLYFNVPVMLTVTTTDGGTQYFAGCYTLHLGQPKNQAAPPYHPMAIASGDLQQVDTAAAAQQIMNQGCQPG